jgi:predicted alpha/beta-fold hydrolase
MPVAKAWSRASNAAVTHSFATRPFRTPWWASDPHVQTILGVFYRDSLRKWPLATPSGSLDQFSWDRRQRFDTPDGDFFDVDFKDIHDVNAGNHNSTPPIVLICHGLQSNSQSFLVKDMARAFIQRGFVAACINYRSCSGSPNKTPRSYHVGFYDDLLQTIQYITTQEPDRDIYLAGFSLGANVVTKLLIDLNEKAETLNIRGAAVNALPMDMTTTWHNVNEPGMSKFLYGDRLKESIVNSVVESYNVINYPFSLEEIKACRTIRETEDLLMTVFGFTDAWDYYEKTKTAPMLHHVHVPQLVIQALDDPFFQGAPNPSATTDMPLKIHYTQHGGHCGYILDASNFTSSANTSWMPTELARFLHHVHTRRSEVALSNASSSLPTNQVAGPVMEQD